MSYFERVRRQLKVERFYTTGTKKNDAYSVDGFYGTCSIVFQAMGCNYQNRPCQETRSSLTEEEKPEKR